MVFYLPKLLVEGFECDELVLYGIRLLAQASLGKLWTNKRALLYELDQ